CRPSSRCSRTPTWTSPCSSRTTGSGGKGVRRGITFGVTAYLIWGLFPLYFPLLQPAGAVEILAHRMVWSLVVSAIVLTAVRGWRAIRTMPPRVWALVLAGAVLIAINWGIYI